MTQTFDTETIHAINIFESLTGVEVKDCIKDEQTVYVIVEEGKIGFAIGRDGSLVKRVEGALRRNIKVFEYSQKLEKFVRNLIPNAKEIKIEGKRVEVKVEKALRPVIIGRDAKNLKILKTLLQRSHGVEELIIR
jgi:N utilization substance protein A